MFDGQRFGAEIVEAVKSYCARAFEPVLARLTAIEQRLADVPKGRDGKDADPVVIKALVDAAVSLAVQRFEPPKDAKLIFVEELAPLVAREVREAMAMVPPPKDGEPGKDADPVMIGELVEAAVTKAVAALPIAAEVEKQIAALPAPKDGEPGKSLTVEDARAAVAPEMEGIRAELELIHAGRAEIERMAAGLNARIEDSIASVEANLNTVIAALPPPKDGEPGAPGKDADPVMVAELVTQEVTKQVAALPPPQPGEPGKSVTVEELAPVIAAEVEKQVAAMPKPASFTEALVPVVAAAVEAAIAALPPVKDGEPGKPGEPGAPGKDVDPAVLAEMVAHEIQKQIAALPPAKDGEPGQPGKDADPVLVAELVTHEVMKQIAALPPAEPGKPGEPGKDGASVSAQDVAPMIVAEVEKAVAALPPAQPGEPGKSVTLDELRPVIETEVAKAAAMRPPYMTDELAAVLVERVLEHVPAVKDGAPGKDGVGVAGAVIDRDGNLVLTLSNGATHPLGQVVGRSVTDAEVLAMVTAAVGAIPKPRDGMGFDDLDLAHDGERGFTFRLARGGDVKEFTFTVPMVIYRGVWREGAFKKGDAVTWAGSLWIAEADTATKPDAADGGWRLAVKRGRDGKGS